MQRTSYNMPEVQLEEGSLLTDEAEEAAEQHPQYPHAYCQYVLLHALPQSNLLN